MVNAYITPGEARTPAVSFKRLRAAPLRDVNAWIERYREFWDASFDALDDVLEDLKQNERAQRKRKETP